MYIIKEFYNKYPYKNVLWICEKSKSILQEQFSKKTLKKEILIIY